MAGASPVSYFDRRPLANDPPIFLISSATAGRQINGGYWFRILGCEMEDIGSESSVASRWAASS
jgi:hypothetical protein